MECHGLIATIEHPELGKLRVRTPTPYDKPLIERFLKRLSEETVFHRFFRRLRGTGEIVEKMLGGKDTLLCIIVERNGEVVACGELYKTTWPDVAEPAVTVLDDLQGKGLGKLLVMLMAHCALKRGIRRFRAYVLPDNKPVMRIMAKLKPALIEDYGDVLLYEMKIDQAQSEINSILDSWNIKDP